RIHGTSMSFNAARMEASEIQVLRKAFATIPALRWRWLLRRKAFSFTAASAAHVYEMCGMPLRALNRLVWSFLLLPIPYQRRDVTTSCQRPKMVLMILWRLLRGSRATSADDDRVSRRKNSVPHSESVMSSLGR